MVKDVRSNRNNQFNGMTVKKRIIDLGDRSIAIANITSIGIAETALSLVMILCTIVGFVILLSSAASFGTLDTTFIRIARFALSFLFFIPVIYYLLRLKVFLTITTNDGRQAIFVSKNIELLHQVKTALDDKIDNETINNCFIANFSEGSIRQINVDDHIQTETLVVNHAQATRGGAAHLMNEAEAHGVEVHAPEVRGIAGNPAYRQNNEHIPLAERLQPLPGGKPGMIDLSGASSTTHDFDISSAPKPDGKGIPHNNDIPCGPGAQPPLSHVAAPLGTQMGAHVGSQVGDPNNFTESSILTDYSAHIQQVGKIREGLVDPQLQIKLDEILVLMMNGTAKPQDKQKLKDQASEMASFVQAYPPIARIFHDIVIVAGT